jgi:hypothetical protein
LGKSKKREGNPSGRTRKHYWTNIQRKPRETERNYMLGNQAHNYSRQLVFFVRMDQLRNYNPQFVVAPNFQWEKDGWPRHFGVPNIFRRNQIGFWDDPFETCSIGSEILSTSETKGTF